MSLVKDQFQLIETSRRREPRREARALYFRRYYLKNREYILQRTAEYKQKHPEISRRALKKYDENHRKERAQKAKEYRKNNPDKARTAQERYRLKNLSRFRAKSSRVRAARAGIKGAHYTTEVNIAARCQMFGNRCYICGRADADSIDHVIPIACKGSHFPANLRPCCRSCNSKKGGKNWKSFLSLLTFMC